MTPIPMAWEDDPPGPARLSPGQAEATIGEAAARRKTSARIYFRPGFFAYLGGAGAWTDEE